MDQHLKILRGLDALILGNVAPLDGFEICCSFLAKALFVCRTDGFGFDESANTVER